MELINKYDVLCVGTVFLLYSNKKLFLVNRINYPNSDNILKNRYWPNVLHTHAINKKRNSSIFEININGCPLCFRKQYFSFKMTAERDHQIKLVERDSGRVSTSR
jgi:thiamine kinase-like enzyme